MKTFSLIPVLIALMLMSVSSHAQQPANLSRLEKDITDGVYPGLYSMLISKAGVKQYERYYNGYSQDSLHDSRSSFKSVASLLVGIAIDRGFIKSVDEHIYTFFPKHPAFNADPEKKKIRIKDLLEMRSGFDCDEWSDNGKDCESEMERTKDWVNYALNIPLKTTPGKVWAYTSCNTMLLSGIIAKATKMSVMDFADRYLFQPLQIRKYKWTVDPAGQGMTAGSFFIRPADMLKLGQLLLNNGTWEGKRIISSRWIIESTKAAIPIPDDASFLRTSKSKDAIPQPTFYGYGWYNEEMKTKDWSYPAIIASGNGGQYIFVIRELDLAVVFTQGNYGSWKAKQAFDILVRYLLPRQDLR